LTKIHGTVKIAGQEVSGHYETESKIPLIVSSCKHVHNLKKKRIGDEQWWDIVHGLENGETSFRHICTNKDKITIDYKK